MSTTSDPETVDELMDRIHNSEPAELTPSDVEALITYHRKNREGGLKPKKETAKKEQKNDLMDLVRVNIKAPEGKTFRRI
jgi:hypothetical protein